MKIDSVIFCIRKDYMERLGGDSIQMLKTKEFIEKLFKFKVKIVTNPSEIRNFDSPIVHIFNLQTIDISLAFAKEAKKLGKFVVLSPIFWDLSHAIYIQFLSKFRIYDIKDYHYKMKPMADLFFKFLSKIIKKPYYYTKEYIEKCKNLISISDMLLPNSIEEKFIIEKIFKIPINTYSIVYNAVDNSIFTYKRNNYKVEKTTIICAARIEPVKNQLNLIKAVLGIENIKLIIVGAVSDQNYFRKIKNEAKKAQFYKNIEIEIINKNIEQNLLAEYFNKAVVHALPSFRESPGLSTLEALSCGLNVVVSSEEFCPINTYFGDLINKKVFICNPYDYLSIRKAINDAIKNKDLTPISMFNYELAAKQTVKAYLNLISKGI